MELFNKVTRVPRSTPPILGTFRISDTKACLYVAGSLILPESSGFEMVIVLVGDFNIGSFFLSSVLSVASLDALFVTMGDNLQGIITFWLGELAINACILSDEARFFSDEARFLSDVARFLSNEVRFIDVYVWEVT